MSDIDGFVFYKSFYDAIKEINNNDERLALYDALLKYAFDNIETTLSGLSNVIYIMAKPQIDANIKKRIGGQKGAEYGALGGRPKKTDTETPNDNPTEKPLGVFDEDNPKIKESKVKENKNTSAHSMREEEAENLFTELWGLYPRKMGKGSVSKKSKMALLKIGREKMIEAIGRFKDDMERQNRDMDKYPYGSTFFNSGYLDYLEEPEAKQDAPPPRERWDPDDYDTWRMRKMEGWTVENGYWEPPPV